MAKLRVGVVGCGLMGAGIAEVCASAGLDVLVREVDEAALAAGRSRIEASLARAHRRGKVDEGDHEAVFDHLRFTTDTLSGAALVADSHVLHLSAFRR